MAMSGKRAESQKKPATTILERMGGEPKHVVHLGKKASSRAQRKPQPAGTSRTTTGRRTAKRP